MLSKKFEALVDFTASFLLVVLHIPLMFLAKGIRIYDSICFLVISLSLIRVYFSTLEAESVCLLTTFLEDRLISLSDYLAFFYVLGSAVPLLLFLADVHDFLAVFLVFSLMSTFVRIKERQSLQSLEEDFAGFLQQA